MSLSFVAIDTETATAQRDSMCQISLVRYKDGVVDDTFTSLVNPEMEKFNDINKRIHHISELEVLAAPTFPDIAEKVFAFIGSDLLVAHNMPFDASVLMRSAERYRISFNLIYTFCTLYATRDEIDCDCVPNYQLPTVCGYYNIPFEHHHDAFADANAAAQIFLCLCKKYNADSAADLLYRIRMSPGRIEPYSTLNCRSGLTAQSFACCNDFIRCSNRKQCQHLDNFEYAGCLYRQNLNAGRIFYGKNKNI